MQCIAMLHFFFIVFFSFLDHAAGLRKSLNAGKALRSRNSIAAAQEQQRQIQAGSSLQKKALTKLIPGGPIALFSFFDSEKTE